MKTALATMKSMVYLCTIIVIFGSCTKDTDLLADYVITAETEAFIVQNLVINDSYSIATPSTMVLDVLSNDSFQNIDKVKIVETSQPTSGSVIINENKTLTYIPKGVDDTISNEIKPKPAEPTIDSALNPKIEEMPDPKTVDDITPPSQEPESTEPEVVPTEEVDVKPIEKSEIPAVVAPVIVEKEQEKKPSTDEFTYTVETTDENGDVLSQEGSVKISFDYGELRAFPGAEGFGKYTTGGRGGRVIHVTNLSDSGVGTLRDAVEQNTGTRTIVFDVSGYINLKSSLKIRPGHGKITIAGQTAPKGGITLRGSSVWILDSNVIIRYISIRPGRDWLPKGPNANSVGDYEPDDAVRIVAFNGSHIRNIILDHCSISWGRDGLLDITAASSNTSIKDITIQNTMLTENVDKGYATLIHGNVDNVTYYKNFIAHCSSRNIAMNAINGDVEFINNVVYGLGRGAWVKYSTKANLIGNVYFTNPNNPRSSETIRLEKNGENPSKTKIYLKDNLDDGSTVSYNSKMKEHLYNSPSQLSGIKSMGSTKVKDEILSAVGNSLNQSEIDKRVIKQMRKYSGRFIKHENEVGGYPSLTSDKFDKNHDSDGDGMSDKWESDNNFSSPYEADSNDDHNDDGFTDLEDYLHYATEFSTNNL